jgi:hypothetical protein
MGDFVVSFVTLWCHPRPPTVTHARASRICSDCERLERPIRFYRSRRRRVSALGALLFIGVDWVVGVNWVIGVDWVVGVEQIVGVDWVVGVEQIVGVDWVVGVEQIVGVGWVVGVEGVEISIEIRIDVGIREIAVGEIGVGVRRYLALSEDAHFGGDAVGVTNTPRIAGWRQQDERKAEKEGEHSIRDVRAELETGETIPIPQTLLFRSGIQSRHKPEP